MPLSVGKILGLKKVKRMATRKIFCECGNVSKGFVYIKLLLDIMMLFNNGDILHLSRLSKMQKISLSAAKCGRKINF